MGAIAVCHVGGEEAKFPDVVMVPKATQVEPELKFQSVTYQQPSLVWK